MRAAAAALALVTACAGAPPKPPEPDLSEAQRLVGEAKSEFEAGHFSRAADLYDRVYRIKPIPELLFNLGQAARFGGDLKRAERGFQAFLLLKADLPAPMRHDVESALAVVRRAIAGGRDPLVAILELRGGSPAPVAVPQERRAETPATADSRYLSNVVRSLAAERGLNVMTRENVTVLLANRDASVADCIDKCEVEVARILGADYVVSGEILRTSDGALHATVQLHESSSARFLAGGQAAGADVGAVEARLRDVLGPLFDRVIERAGEKSH